MKFKPAKKSLGQNFLHDKNIQMKIINSFKHLDENEDIIEIGPGRGALTENLLKLEKNLTLIEFDHDLAEYWKMQEGDRLKLIEEDVLKIDFHRIVKNKQASVIGNIPYNITSPILFKLFENRAYISEAVIMMQKEVADRIVAKNNSKAYGILSVQSQFFSKPSFLFNVPATVFRPRPNVDSSVLHFDFSKDLKKDFNILLFKEIVRKSFNHRRKMLRVTLKAMIKDIKNIDFDFTRRPESLEVSEFIFLTNEIEKRIKNN